MIPRLTAFPGELHLRKAPCSMAACNIRRLEAKTLVRRRWQLQAKRKRLHTASIREAFSVPLDLPALCSPRTQPTCLCDSCMSHPDVWCDSFGGSSMAATPV